MSDSDSAINRPEDQSSEDSESECLQTYHDLINESNFWNYFDSARKHVKEKKQQEALIILKALTLKGAEIFGSQIHVNLGIVYFEMGNVILGQLEQSPMGMLGAKGRGGETHAPTGGVPPSHASTGDIPPSHTPTGGVPSTHPPTHNSSSHNASGSVPGNARKEPIDAGDFADFEENEGENEGGEEEEDVEELQVAWENLDLARKILEDYIEEHLNLTQEEVTKYRSQLADAYLRLGDLENWREEFSRALEEYQKSLKTLEKFEVIDFSRRAAELHFLLGNTFLYNLSEDKNAIEKALKHYKTGKRIIENVISKASEAEKGELKDVLAAMELKVAETEEEFANKDQIKEELEKIKELKEKKEEGFAKSQFDQNALTKVGKYVAGKKMSGAGEEGKPASKRVNKRQEDEADDEKNSE